MLFSVVTVTFNNLEGLRQTAASLPADCRLYEWIVIDGASRDGTAAWLSSQNRQDLLWVSEPDSGIFDAMNKGIMRARGDYVIFMNAGDAFASDDVLPALAAFLGTARPDLLYGDSIERDMTGGTWLKPARSPAWNRYAMFTHHQAILYRRDRLAAGYDPAYRFAGDWSLTSRILACPGRQVLHFPGVICHFLRGGVSQRNDHRRRINAEHWRILRQEYRLALPLALLLYHGKLLANRFRHALPRLYDRIRFSDMPD
ncbi:glycosyltransferase family 2 protein [Pseudogemmobacter humi]|uniref:PGL/p-HBAD biosynthesis glycosyltransferase/MT3031 n=1 Tax=Pseudogemmobacter humi TaxID=2483812 RepID=A0A3P5XGT9_9RHOB|nr:glycosyltransferase family 2 protein [Pseudogemmobacter humi]VDC33963.1 PGL/p-HBAD biosynthesis glycosyltransferase/MT3031 [Pseudogemmobacter humi]